MKFTLPRGILIVFAILVCAASLAGCNYPGYSTNETTGPQAQFTQAAQTLQVMLTENAPFANAGVHRHDNSHARHTYPARDSHTSPQRCTCRQPDCYRKPEPCLFG